MSNALALEHPAPAPVLAVAETDPDCPECGEELVFYALVEGTRPRAYERCRDCGLVLLAD